MQVPIARLALNHLAVSNKQTAGKGVDVDEVDSVYRSSSIVADNLERAGQVLAMARR